MSVDRRAELIEAGISLLAREGFQDLMAAVETRAVADEVGVTTGSFFHHFRNRSHFASAVGESFVAAWRRRVTHLRSASAAYVEDDGANGVRRPASEEWQALIGGADTATLQHLLWAVRSQPLSDESSRTAGDVLRECYEHLASQVEGPYRDALTLLGREMLPPFTPRDHEVVMTAFAEGLQMRHGVDPEAIRDELYVDAISAILLGITRPRLDQGATTPSPELAHLESRFLVHRHDGAATGAPTEVWHHIAQSAAHLFVDRAASDVTVSEVAAAAGVSPGAVRRQFGTVTAVAAAGWICHLPELEGIASTPTTPEEGPIRRIEQVMLRCVQLTRRNRGAAEALVNQLLAEAGGLGQRPWPRDTRAAVPLADLLVPLLRELRTSGRLRRRVEVERLARSLVHLCAMQALLFTDESDERIVDETMSLVFDGALVAPSDE